MEELQDGLQFARFRQSELRKQAKGLKSTGVMMISVPSSLIQYQFCGSGSISDGMLYDLIVSHTHALD